MKKSKSLLKTYNDPTKNRIHHLRSLMLIHSAIYYDLNDNVVDDHTWQAWADELEKIQKANPDKIKINYFDHEFRDWDGSTGSHLPHRHPWVTGMAKYILELHKSGSFIEPVSATLF